MDFMNDFSEMFVFYGFGRYVFFMIFFSAAFTIAVIALRRILAKDREEKDKTDLEISQMLGQPAPTEKPAAPIRTKYPVTCPGCGATAYPNDDGTCQYCGRAIVRPDR